MAQRNKTYLAVDAHTIHVNRIYSLLAMIFFMMFVDKKNMNFHQTFLNRNCANDSQ